MMRKLCIENYYLEANKTFLSFFLINFLFLFYCSKMEKEISEDSYCTTEEGDNS